MKKVKKIKKVWYEDDFSGNSRSLIAAFAGQLIVPGKFEWANTWAGLYKDLDFKKIRLCDHKLSWYQTTFPDIDGYGPYALAKFLKNKIEEANVDKVAFMGLSMGGYGALLLGEILEVDQVITFSPQTHLTKGRYKKASLDKRFKGFDIDKDRTDFKYVLENSKNKKTIYHIYYGDLNKSDVSHAKRIEHFDNVVLHPVPSKVHTVARVLVKDGTVGKIMKNFIDGK